MANDGSSGRLPLSIRLKEGHFVEEPPQTFTRYTVTGFPILEPAGKYLVPRQDSLGGLDTETKTILMCIEKVPNRPYMRYWIEHETWRHELVRFGDELVPKVKKVIRFNAFVSNEEQGVIWFQAKKQYIDQMLRRIHHEKQPDMSALRHEVDVVQMIATRKDHPEDDSAIFGAWFINLNIPQLQAAMLQGIDIDESMDFERYLDAGDLASIELVKTYAGEPIRVLVTRRGAVVIRSNVSDSFAMEILDDVRKVTSPFESPTSINWQGRR